MRKILLLLFVFLSAYSYAPAQQAAAIDSMKKSLSEAKTLEQKTYWLDILSRTLMNHNLKEADKYGEQLIYLAEESRDRKQMVLAYMSNGTRCSYFATVQDYTQRAIEYFNKALTIARQNNLDDLVGAAYLKLAAIHLAIPDKEKALNYAQQAYPVISSIKNDSLAAELNNTFGHIYLSKNEKTVALRNYLTALRIAENIKNHALIRNCYVYLSSFYSGIEEYDKAIDYLMAAYKKLDDIKEKNVPYQRAIDVNSIGKLYSSKKSHDLAINYFERSIAMADSLKFSNLKVPAYTSLLNQYLRMDQPRKALEYFNSASGQGLKDFLSNFGFSGAIDQAYGVIYTELGQLDSAKFYFERAKPDFEKNPNETTKMYFYAQLGAYHKQAGEYLKSIEYYTRVKEIADHAGQLETAEKAAKHLDTLYRKTGDFQQASIFNSIYYQYKDSIDKLNKQKELSQVEAAEEQYRLKKLEEEKAEKKRRKNNIQYMSITLGIAGLFIMLVVLGMFKVSAKTIRLIGFFGFIMFFEFIFLLFKKNIYSLTDGEPLKDLAFMIALAAILVPLHHWLEHRVIHYLTSHNRLTASGKTLISRVFARKPSEAESKH